MYTWYKNVLELIHSLIEQHFGLSIRKKSIRIKLNILINCKIPSTRFHDSSRFRTQTRSRFGAQTVFIQSWKQRFSRTYVSYGWIHTYSHQNPNNNKHCRRLCCILKAVEMVDRMKSSIDLVIGEIASSFRVIRQSKWKINSTLVIDKFIDANTSRQQKKIIEVKCKFYFFNKGENIQIHRCASFGYCVLNIYFQH